MVDLPGRAGRKRRFNRGKRGEKKSAVNTTTYATSVVKDEAN